MPVKPNTHRLEGDIFQTEEPMGAEDDVATRKLICRKLQGKRPNKLESEQGRDWEYTVAHFYPDENRWETGEEPVYGTVEEANALKKNLEMRYKGHKYRVVGRPIIEWQPIYEDETRP